MAAECQLGSLDCYWKTFDSLLLLYFAGKNLWVERPRASWFCVCCGGSFISLISFAIQQAFDTKKKSIDVNTYIRNVKLATVLQLKLMQIAMFRNYYIKT